MRARPQPCTCRVTYEGGGMIKYPCLGHLCRHIALWSVRTGVMAMTIAWSASIVRADPPIRLKIVGGLAGVSQYERLEKPFWDHRIEELSNGRIKAEIHRCDRSGLPGQEMLQLMRLGVVPFGTALLA